VEICRIWMIPLAISWPRRTASSPAEIATRLDDLRPAHRWGARGLPRHQTLRR